MGHDCRPRVLCSSPLSDEQREGADSRFDWKSAAKDVKKVSHHIYRVLDWRFTLWRFLAFVPGVLALLLLYLRTKKLASVMVAHWILDVIAAATTLSF